MCACIQIRPVHFLKDSSYMSLKTENLSPVPLADSTGWYTYFETSSIPVGAEAGLESPLLPGNNSNYCQMEFFYHMYGFHVGSLSVLVSDGEIFKVSNCACE